VRKRGPSEVSPHDPPRPRAAFHTRGVASRPAGRHAAESRRPRPRPGFLEPDHVEVRAEVAPRIRTEWRRGALAGGDNGTERPPDPRAHPFGMPARRSSHARGRASPSRARSQLPAPQSAWSSRPEYGRPRGTSIAYSSGCARRVGVSISLGDQATSNRYPPQRRAARLWWAPREPELRKKP